MKPAIFILGPSALPLARTLKVALAGEIHAPDGGDVSYAKATDHLAALFGAGRTLIGLCAAGILIRAVGPGLKDKRSEPPVIAVAEDGSSAIPLLGGHHGANALARRIAALTSGHAAITTASELHFGAAFDEPPAGYRLQNPGDVKAFTARVLAGEPIRLRGEAPWLGQVPQSDEARLEVLVTDRDVAGGPERLVYHPKCLTVGVGCERGAEAAELIANVEAALGKAGLSRHAVAAIASIDLKEDEPAIHGLAAHLAVDAVFLSATALSDVEHLLPTPSPQVKQEVGVAGVAEAAALRLFSPDAQLVVPKQKTARTTCAIARIPAASAIAGVDAVRGHPNAARRRGVLSVVGIGPGAEDMRSPAARAAIAAASDWVGYDLYLDLVADLRQGQTEHRFPLGGEEDRVRHAIALAKQGKRVALVCSGDAGIYAMASLVYEIIDLEPARIEVEVIPGISAFQAAAAKAGAMIGHDFCCISLSDLLTPWEAIEKRVKAAAEGDFVVSFYNPRSLKRRDQLLRAMALLAPHRPPDTPVVIATSLGRSDEMVKIVRFADFNPDDVDMLTLVMVGSSQSKSFQRGDGHIYAYTPRGYAKKREAT